MAQVGDIFFRYEYLCFGNPEGYSGAIKLQQLQFEVTKVTECGVWIQPRSPHGWVDQGRKPKFVLLRTYVGGKGDPYRRTRKRYACPSSREALQGFIHRRYHQIAILKSRLNEVENALQVSIAAMEEHYYAEEPLPQVEG